ncbi:MAG: SPFH domain-containing protein [Treponema sp.]|nr:SPFH domain-containing protein [Treponema sp.]
MADIGNLEMAQGILYGALGLGAFIVFIGMIKMIIKVALPNRIMVVTGRKTRRGGKTFGFSVNRGRTAVIPYFQAVGSLDLDVFPINVRVEGVNSANGITVGADATACVCIDDDEEAMLYSAVERLMGKDSKQIHDQVQQTLVGNFRGALNKATPLQAIGMVQIADAGESGAEGEDGDSERAGERAHFRTELFSDINADLRSFGMKVVSVSLQKIWDTSNYIANLAQKTLAEKRQQVEIEESRLRAIAEQSESDAHRRMEVAKNSADEAIIAARQELEMYRQESQGLVKEASIRADQSIAQAANSGEAAVQKMMVELQKLKNQTALTLQAQALEEEARIIAEGEQEAVAIKRSARNTILKNKAELISKYGNDAQAVLFLQEKLPLLYATYMESAKNVNVDSFVVMNDEEGFSGAVNRGPRAFADFLKMFTETFAVDIKSFIAPDEKGGNS